MKDGEFVTITNADIYKEIKELTKLAQATHDQAVKTNGRVTKLESRSLGNWIANHPFKFTLFVVVFISLLSPDAREAIFALAKSQI